MQSIGQWAHRAHVGGFAASFGRVKYPLANHVPDRMTLLLTDPTLAGIRNMLKSRITDAGLAFMVGGKLSNPDPDFKHLTQVHWEPFMSKALDFIIAYGYLVWFLYTPSNAIHPVPSVPDLAQLTVKIDYGKHGAPEVDAQWKDKDLQHIPLEIFYHPIPFRVTPAHPESLVDQVAPLLFMMCALNEAHATAAGRSSNPAMVLQRPPVKDPNTGEREGFAGRARETEHDQREMFDKQLDDMALARIRELANGGPSDDDDDAIGPVAPPPPAHWYERANKNLTSASEHRYNLVPYGLSFARVVETRAFGNYVQEYLMLQQQVYAAFAFPIAAMGGGAAEKTSKGASMQDESLVLAFTKYRKLMETLMTDVYRKAYPRPPQQPKIGKTATKGGEKGKSTESTTITAAEQFHAAADEYRQADPNEVHVILESQHRVNSSDAAALYYDRVINHKTFQNLSARAVGLNTELIDTTLKEPVELVEQAILASAQSSSKLTGKRDGGGGGGPAAKKVKTDSS